MGSVKLKDLKAYVRYDGSGRVVSGSLVFRKKKPKNGRWVEIPKNLCCNGNPSSTTTTTTQGGGGNTPTAWVTYIAGNQESACTQTSGWNFVLYTAGSTLGAGVVLYTDAALTTEFNSYQYASILYNNGTLYQLSDLPGDGTIVNVIGACPTILIATNYYSSQDACEGIMAVSTATVYPSNPNLSTGTTLWLDPQFTQPYQSGMAIWVTFSGHPGFAFATQSSMGTTSISYAVPCPTTTTTTTLSFGNAGFVSNGITAVCNNQGQFNLPLSIDPNACSNGGITLTSGTYPDYGIPNGSTIYINLQDGNVIQVQTFGSSQMSYGCTSCPTTTTTTTFNPFEPTTTTTTTAAPVTYRYLATHCNTGAGTIYSSTDGNLDGITIQTSTACFYISIVSSGTAVGPLPSYSVISSCRDCGI
jgi:hypothetical protein